jgi:hypothetical protein
MIENQIGNVLIEVYAMINILPLNRRLKRGNTKKC